MRNYQPHPLSKPSLFLMPFLPSAAHLVQLPQFLEILWFLIICMVPRRHHSGILTSEFLLILECQPLGLLDAGLIVLLFSPASVFLTLALCEWNQIPRMKWSVYSLQPPATLFTARLYKRGPGYRFWSGSFLVIQSLSKLTTLRALMRAVGIWKPQTTVLSPVLPH